MSCELCRTRPVPSSYGSPRVCAFDDAGVFTTDNWNCETLNEIRWALPDEPGEWASFKSRMDDESVGVTWLADDLGWLIMTWYKGRGRVGRAVVMCDDSEPAPLRLEQAETHLASLRAGAIS